MTNKDIYIDKLNDTTCDFQVHNMERRDFIWLQVENFTLYIKRTDVGITVEVFDVDSNTIEGSMAFTYALDEHTTSFLKEET